VQSSYSFKSLFFCISSIYGFHNVRFTSDFFRSVLSAILSYSFTFYCSFFYENIFNCLGETRGKETTGET
jgi:hypothetical protein